MVKKIKPWGGRIIALCCLSFLFIIAKAQSPKKESFNYYQSFNPSSKTVTVQSGSETRLAFDDVREEISLSSWNKSNWEIVNQGIKVTGSRRKEVLRRAKKIRDTYGEAKPNSIIRPYRTPWLTLSLGDLNWCDYKMSTTVKFENRSIAGIAFRYLNPREYYAFLLDAEKGKVRLVLRKMNQEATADRLAWDELESVDFDLLTHKTYHISVDVDAQNNIECSVDNSVVIKFKDSYREEGKVALIADDPVEFGPVTVNGKKLVVKEKPSPRFSKPQLIHELPLPGGDISRRFFLLDVDSDGEREIVIAESDHNVVKYTYRCIEFDGKELWKINDIEHRVSEGGDVTLQAFDIDGDGKNEIVITADFKIQVREGKTGKLLWSTSTPEQNPYFDSKDYKYTKLLGDAICPVKFAADKPPGFYLKDRYTNIWLFDNGAKQLWHKAMSTAHFPLPVDVNKDGIDEILVNHTLLKSDGSVIWSLPLEDHVDNISYVSLNPGLDPEYFYLAGGEMGLLKVNPDDGEILKRFQLGHIQQITIADFIPEKKGLELLTYTTWREDRIFYLFDKDLNMISTWQGVGGRPAPWGVRGGGDLLVGSEGIVDPLTGKVIYPYNFGTILDVIADKRWGNAVVVTEKGNILRIYASPRDSQLEPVRFLNKHIQSDYLPEVSVNLHK